ncbi:MraY family glycosyltransferase [Methylolobus aquaticus]
MDSIEEGVLTTLPGVTIAAWLMTGLIRQYALRRLIDVPNDRSSHRVPTPRGGGLAVVLAFFAGCFAAVMSGAMSPAFLGLLGSGLIVAGAGFWDDHGHVPAGVRLAAHTAAGTVAIGLIGGFPELPLGSWTLSLGWFGTGFALLWLLWSLNLFNFMDGIDAIAGTEAIFVAGGALALMAMQPEGLGATSAALAVLTAASAGFLWWNWPPAKIFLGDVGSGFIGYSLALIALADMRSPGGGLGLPVWVILNGLFVVDATYTLARRFITGQRWYSPHRLHAYQKAATILGGHRPVVIYALCINTLWLLPCAFAAQRWPNWAVPLLGIALLPLLTLVVRLKAGDP